jgi:hypothetical protein
VYLPFWTYDCRTSSDYRGERGDDYYTTETYTTRNSAGETVTQTRQVRQTRWTAASGHVEHFHDDVLVMATNSLPAHIVDSTERWNLKALVPYKPEFVSGFQAEAYRVGLREGFPAREGGHRHPDPAARRARHRRRPPAHPRRLTRYTDIKFKHVLLPVWVSAYRYRDKAYRFVINGQTGEVSGESPKSWWKIALLALAILVGFFVLLMIGSSR